MTETEVKIDFTAGMCDFVPNKVISNVMTESLFEIGAPKFDLEDEKIAQQFFSTLSQDEISSALKRAAESYDEVERFRNSVLIKEIAPFKKIDSCGFGSTDVGDVSYCTPTAQLHITAFANGTPGHSWQVTAQGKNKSMHKALITAGKVLALTAIKLFEQPEILKEAHYEYEKTTGGRYVCPVGMDVKPKI